MKFPKKLFVVQITEHVGTDDETTYYTAAEDVDAAYDNLQEADGSVAIYVLVEVGTADRVTKFIKKKD